MRCYSAQHSSHEFFKKDNAMPTESTVQVSNEIVEEILRAISQLRYGSIEITLHEGRVTQIEKREKLRFAQETTRIKPTATGIQHTVSTAATI